MLETLQNAPYLEVHKDMIRWILKVKCPDITLLFVGSIRHLLLVLSDNVSLFLIDL